MINPSKSSYVADRPRERLELKGAEALTEFELIQALIGSGNAQISVAQVARRVLSVLQTDGPNFDYSRMVEISGIGPAKAAELVAAFELSRRYLIPAARPIIDSPAKAAEQLSDIGNKLQEHFVVMTLDGANRLIAKRTITIGTLTASLVHPREVFADAITDRAAGIIVAHNHPSKSLNPSTNDHQLTNQLIEVGELLGIHLYWHLIISQNGFATI